MTIDETAAIMDILATAYPRFYSGPDAPDSDKVLALWADLFADDEPSLVGAAVKSLIASDERGFPPHIGAVKEQMRKLANPQELTEGEAWALVAKAVRNSIYGAREQFEKLPPELQKLVGSPAQLREWAVMDSGTLHSVVSSNIQRAYKAVVKRERERAKLPEDVRRVIAAVSQKMAIDGPIEALSKKETKEAPNETAS